MGFAYDDFFIIISSSYMGKKWILKLSTFLKKTMTEIFNIAISCFFITLFGLALGFLFLQIQANT